MHSIVRFPDAVIVEVNETFTRNLGYAREEVIGKTPLQLNFWVAPQRLLEYRAQLEANGFVRDFEVELRQVISSKCRDDVPPELKQRIAEALGAPVPPDDKGPGAAQSFLEQRAVQAGDVFIFRAVK